VVCSECVRGGGLIDAAPRGPDRRTAVFAAIRRRVVRASLRLNFGRS